MAFTSFKDVEIVNGRTIRKLSSTDAKTKVMTVTGYLSGVKDGKSNLAEVQSHDNLTAAREACGFVQDLSKQKSTPKKLSYKQNQKGYDPHAR